MSHLSHVRQRKFALLPGRFKESARSEAKSYFRTFDGDFAVAAVDMEHRLRMTVGSMWLSIAVTLAIELLKWWWSRRQSDPSFFPGDDFVAGEPGAD